MDAQIILQIANAGIGAVSLFILSQLWTWYKKKDQFIQEVLENILDEQREARRQRSLLAKAAGVDEREIILPIHSVKPIPHKDD